MYNYYFAVHIQLSLKIPLFFMEKYTEFAVFMKQIAQFSYVFNKEVPNCESCMLSYSFCESNMTLPKCNSEQYCWLDNQLLIFFSSYCIRI